MTTSRLPGAALAWVLVFAASSVAAQPAVRQVLLLQSFDRGNLTLDSFTANFRVELDRGFNTPVNVVQVVVGQTGLTGAPEHAVLDYIRATFAERRTPDLIVTVAGPAAAFAARKASTQPASEMLSRMKPRQMPQAIEKTSTPATAYSTQVIPRGW